MARRRLGQILLGVGFASLILGAWAGAQYRTATALRIFFVNPFGMAMGEDGRIYVGADRREIHAYDTDGRPVAAWTVDQDAGRFRIRHAAAGRIEVAREQPGELIVYDADGAELSRQSDAGAFARFGGANDARVVSASGTVYELTPEGLVRSSPGPRTLLVAVPSPPLVWLGSRPIKALATLLFLGPAGLMAGAVLTATSASDREGG